MRTFALVAFLPLVMSCSHFHLSIGEQEQLIDCGAPEVIAEMPVLALDVLAALEGSAVSWASALDTLYAKAPAATMCVVKTVVADYESGYNSSVNQAGVLGLDDAHAKARLAAAHPKLPQVLARGYAWLLERHVRFVVHPPPA